MKSQGFDLRTHIRDVKTGQIVKKQPYQLKVERNKPKRFIRDGIVYGEDGSVIEELTGEAYAKSPKTQKIVRDFNEYAAEHEKEVRARIEKQVRAEVEEKVRKEIEEELAKE